MIPDEPVIRMSAFLAVFASCALVEILRPRRARTAPRPSRWPGNLGLTALNTLAVRVFVPGGAVGIAWAVEQAGWGASPWADFDGATRIALDLLALDLAIWAQHRAFHAVPWLWRLHRVHHADLDLDVTSGARFHTIEILISLAWKGAVIAVLAPAPGTVLAFEVVLNATSMFNHANLGIPESWDRVLRWVVVTPDMHRVHHSIVKRETNSNFGFNVPWWDRLFRTYVAAPTGGQLGMTLGVREFRRDGESRIDRLLLQPFRS